jgi:hypothetical protein
MKKRNSGEYQIQMRFFNWVRRNVKNSPNEKLREMLSLCSASLNGADMNVQERQRMFMAGLVPGLPDVTLDVPSVDFNARKETFGAFIDYGRNSKFWICPGLKMEFKYGKNTLTPEQKKMKRLFLKSGWKWEEPRSVREAIDIVMDYLPFQKEDYVKPKYL